MTSPAWSAAVRGIEGGYSVVRSVRWATSFNWATPSVPERKLWGPTTTVMLLLVAIVVFLG